MSTTIEALIWTARFATAILWRHGLTARGSMVARRHIRRLEWRTEQLRRQNMATELQIIQLRHLGRSVKETRRMVEGRLEALRRARNQREASRR